ncbi:MAG: J domain-containing protein [Cyanobacteria bacterium P01_E01_bin.34]
MAAKSKATKKASSKRKKRPNINQIRAEIRKISKEHGYSESIMLNFAEFVNGGVFPAVEPSMNELKQEVISAFGCTSYQQLKKDGNFQLFVQDRNLRMNSKKAWLTVYRRFVGLPDGERDAIGSTAINGVDVLRNFLPWKVFQLDPKTATAENIKSAFNLLAKQYHPDLGGNPEVFQKLKAMRDSLLAAY